MTGRGHQSVSAFHRLGSSPTRLNDAYAHSPQLLVLTTVLMSRVLSLGYLLVVPNQPGYVPTTPLPRAGSAVNNSTFKRELWRE